MKIGWFSKFLMAICIWFIGKLAPKKSSHPIKKEVKQVIPDLKDWNDFSYHLPNPNYSVWYRKTFERPSRNRRKFGYTKPYRRHNRKK